MKVDRPWAVLDLDGVVADARWRLPLIGVDGGDPRDLQSRLASTRKKDWDEFYARVGEDPVLETGRNLALSLAHWCDVVYCSGRRESTRADTLEWLDRHGLLRADPPPVWAQPDGLLLRRNDDHRQARVIKPEMLPPANFRNRSQMWVIVDDDPRVCEAFYQVGYRVLQATWGRS